MRSGLSLVLSVISHVAVVAFGFVALPDARPLDAPNLEALPVELVTIAEVTDLSQGDKKSEIPPAEEPQPVPKQVAPEEAPVNAETPSEEPVEATREPEPEPQAEPEPEQTEDIAILIPDPEPEPVPVPEPLIAAPVEPEIPPEVQPQPDSVTPPQTPKSRPAPPKDVKPVVAKPQPEKAQEFKPNDIAALLDKRDAAGGGSPIPSETPQTFGSETGADSSAMTQSEVEALKARLYQCWNPPRGVREARSLKVTIGIDLLPDGRLSGPPRMVSVGIDQLARLAAESAVRAIQLCEPFDILPPEKYQTWKQIEFVFDPREMLGG